jgi:hypothetical protein
MQGYDANHHLRQNELKIGIHIFLLNIYISIIHAIQFFFVEVTQIVSDAFF